MNKEEALSFLKAYEEKGNAYRLALSTMSFDTATIAPKDGADYRIKMMSILEGEYLMHSTNPESMKKIEEMASMDLDELTKEAVNQHLIHLKEIRMIPKDVYMAYEELLGQSNALWEQCKKTGDWDSYKQMLKDVIIATRKYTDYYRGDMSCYDALLDRNEPGMNIEKYDAFFKNIKDRLVPFIKKIQAAKQIDTSLLKQYFPQSEQEKVMEDLKEYMNFNPNRCYMGVSVHPFTSPFSLKDTRLTTAYRENALTSSIFSIIHEYGHAQYMQHVDEKLEGSILSRNMSNGMHESQSRLLENFIARSKAFWTCNFDKLKSHFPEQLKDCSLDDFIRMINASSASLIRTEADELTYPLHILIRYELEKQIFNSEVDFDHLDQLWADKYEEYLGVRPLTADKGILQDVHWPQGLFGYFPTYALGTAYAAQFYQAMCRDIDVEAALNNNEFYRITNWLTENIHQYGSSKNADELLHDVCHQEFDSNIYIDYLIDKYSKLYNL